MICTVFLQTGYLNSAMQMGDIMTVYPVFQAFWIGFGVFGGIVFYQDAKKLSTGNWIAYVIAACMMVLGCIFFFKHAQREWGVIRRRILKSHFSALQASKQPQKVEKTADGMTDSPGNRYAVNQAVYPEKEGGGQSECDTHSMHSGFSGLASENGSPRSTTLGLSGST